MATIPPPVGARSAPTGVGVRGISLCVTRALRVLCVEVISALCRPWRDGKIIRVSILTVQLRVLALSGRRNAMYSPV